MCGEVGLKVRVRRQGYERAKRYLSAERRGLSAGGGGGKLGTKDEEKRERGAGAGVGGVEGTSGPNAGERGSEFERVRADRGKRYMVCEAAYGLRWLGLRGTHKNAPITIF